MKCLIRLSDTCLSCNALRTHDLAIPVDGATTVADVIREMQRDAHAYGFQAHDTDAPGEFEAFDAAIDAMRLDNADRLDRPCFPSLDVMTDDDNSESVYAYFDVTFEVDE